HECAEKEQPLWHGVIFAQTAVGMAKLPLAWRALHSDARRKIVASHKIRSLVRMKSQLPAPESAKIAGLRYVNEEHTPGIRRLGSAKRVRYVMPNGRRAPAAELARIKALVIPPAWTDVWICPDARGHLQATGRDARGRKQYRYHPKWRVARDETKYDRVIGFAKVLPVIRRTTSDHLRRPGLPREKVLATVVQLLEKTLIRVGNDEYARSNRSFGLTTLRDGHV